MALLFNLTLFDANFYFNAGICNLQILQLLYYSIQPSLIPIFTSTKASVIFISEPNQLAKPDLSEQLGSFGFIMQIFEIGRHILGANTIDTNLIQEPEILTELHTKLGLILSCWRITLVGFGHTNLKALLPCTNVLNDITAAPFSVSFSQLPAGKRH